MELNHEEFYNGKALLAGLVNEDIIAYYIYDRDKPEAKENYREIAYFLTEKHLIKTVTRHHSIEINKWKRNNIMKVKKIYDVMLYNTSQATNISKIIVYMPNEEIVLKLPKEWNKEEQMDNFFDFIQKM